MVRDKYAVRLAQEQREELQRLVRVGKNSARVTARARIIIKSADGWAAPQVAEALDVALSTVYRVKQRFAEEGLEKVLQDRPQANRPRKLDDRGEAHRPMVWGSRSSASAAATAVQPWASRQTAYHPSRSRGVGARIILRRRSFAPICHCSKDWPISLTPIINPSQTTETTYPNCLPIYPILMRISPWLWFSMSVVYFKTR